MEFVDANGLRFAYLAEGSGPLVLLVHGFPDTAYSWDRVMPELARAGFRAVAPFTRGYHPTTIPADRRYDADALGGDLVALIDALGEHQAIVVGHDWGALAAIVAAATSPARVRMLVTVGVPHPYSVLPTPNMLWSVRHFLTLGRKSGPAKLRANGFAYLDELVQRWSPAWHPVPRSETTRVKEAFAAPGSAEAACGYYAAITPFMPPSLRAKIVVPSVAFAGLHDNISTKPYERARRCYRGPYEVVHVPGGHFMHREYPEPFVAELLRVLRSAPT